MAHLGRPEGRDESQSLKPVREILEKELGEQIVFAEEVDLAWINANTEAYKPGKRIVLLENVRFFPGENSKNKGEQAVFADQLSRLGSIFINDAFADYRESPSTFGVAQIMPSYIGPVLYKEVSALANFSDPARPFMAVMAGVKLSEKIDSLKALLGIADKVMVGGALAYTILKAKGNTIGISLVEDEKINVAKEILADYADKLLLPIDHIVVKEFKQPAADSGYQLIDSQDIPDGLMGVDIGPKTQALYKVELAKANSILWNGPLGIYEWGKTAAGTDAIIEAIVANNHAYKLIGGGDSITVTNQMSVAAYDHICTGGGAMLAFLAYDKFPILDVIFEQL
jgi:phosphoglycerate kinase